MLQAERGPFSPRNERGEDVGGVSYAQAGPLVELQPMDTGISRQGDRRV